jgi:hypothetical protein
MVMNLLMKMILTLSRHKLCGVFCNPGMQRLMTALMKMMMIALMDLYPLSWEDNICLTLTLIQMMIAPRVPYLLC